MATNKSNHNPNNNDNKKNMKGFVTIVLWALVLTMVANYFLSGMNSRDTVTVYYSDFRNAVEAGAVEVVDMDTNAFTFYLRDGWTMNEDGELMLTGFVEPYDVRTIRKEYTNKSIDDAEPVQAPMWQPMKKNLYLNQTPTIGVKKTDMMYKK